MMFEVKRDLPLYGPIEFLHQAISLGVVGSAQTPLNVELGT